MTGAPLSRKRPDVAVEWGTLGLIAACYAGWALATTLVAGLWLPLGVGLTALMLALHSSLSHEVLHGHPFRQRWANEALMFPAIGLCIPYIRFRDTHLAHHLDANLTDPYDDPESNYQDPAVWSRLPGWLRAALNFNNTLIGRLLIGPVVAQVVFMAGDWRAMRGGDRQIAYAWLMHLAGLVPVGLWLAYAAQMPLWSYLLAAYMGISILKIRTFLEHQAHEKVCGRTVVIEDRGLLAFLFLNNNFHVVHHMHPDVPWHRLPALYAANRARYLDCNQGYRYGSYREVFRRYFWRAKDPVPHPLMRR